MADLDNIQTGNKNVKEFLESLNFDIVKSSYDNQYRITSRDKIYNLTTENLIQDMLDNGANNLKVEINKDGNSEIFYQGNDIKEAIKINNEKSLEAKTSWDIPEIRVYKDNEFMRGIKSKFDEKDSLDKPYFYSEPFNIKREDLDTVFPKSFKQFQSLHRVFGNNETLVKLTLSKEDLKSVDTVIEKFTDLKSSIESFDMEAKLRKNKFYPDMTSENIEKIHSQFDLDKSKVDNVLESLKEYSKGSMNIENETINKLGDIKENKVDIVNKEKDFLDNFSITINSLDGIDKRYREDLNSVVKVGEEAKGEKAQNLLQTLVATDMMLKENYLKKGQISLNKIGVDFQINDKKFNLDLPFGQGVFSKNFNEILQLHTNDLTPNFLNEKETKGYYEIIERFGKRKDDKTKVKSNLGKTTENVIDFGIDSGLSLANSLDEDIGELAKGFESAFKTFHQIQTPELKNEVKNNDSKKNNIDDFTKDFLKKVSSGEIKIGTEAKKEHSIHKEKDKGR